MPRKKKKRKNEKTLVAGEDELSDKMRGACENAKKKKKKKEKTLGAGEDELRDELRRGL